MKSEVGLAWGGKTIWILQDRLVEYISKSTALNIYDFAAEDTSGVNILSLSYDDISNEQVGVINLTIGELYAGLIKPPSAKPEPSFQDMIRTSVVPPLSVLMRLLVSKKPVNIINL